MITVRSMTITGWPVDPPRGFRKASKTNLKRFCEDWHKRDLPSHFKGGAASKYGYKKRSAKHAKRKLEKFGHTVPLIYDGLLRQSTKNLPKVAGGRQKASLTMTVPWYVKAGSRRRGRGPDMEAELTTTTGAERDKLMSDYRDRVVDDMNASRARKRIRI